MPERPKIKYKDTPPHLLAPPDNPGSKPLFRAKQEAYCRNRANMLPRYKAYHQAFKTKCADIMAASSATELERLKHVQERIAYLTNQQTDQLREKHRLLEQQLWDIAQADLAAAFDTNGIKSLQDMPDEIRQAIDVVGINEKGRPVSLKLYSKLAANAELRKMLHLDKPSPVQSDTDRLTDAELVNELAKQANELGVKIDLSYKFGDDD